MNPVHLPYFVAAAVVCCWLGLVWRTAAKTRLARRPQASSRVPIVVAYASQTGTAKEIAERTAHAFGPERALLMPMAQLTPARLLDFQYAVFVVSTYGEGDPPDPAQSFFGRARAHDAPSLPHLKGAVLALGDSAYRHYCGFGRALNDWLQRQGATVLFEPVLVDKGDPKALRAWGEHLDEHFGARPDLDEVYEEWRLAGRRHMNPESLGGACYELVFHSAIGSTATWEAGDIARIRIDDRGLHRDYSIASIPSEGVLRLLLRQHRDAKGRPGVGSHWLTDRLELGAIVPINVRRNPLFHVPDDGRPAIFIGNGTGIAGLRGLLNHRVEMGHTENWLIFGERQRACDFHYGDELRDLRDRKQLARMDVAFSRDQPEKHYVHHLLLAAAAELCEWVARGAVVYVCGSKDGMARDVDKALRQVLGSYGYVALLERQGYRRDVY